jgi:ribosomal-protein-alanine N-acetyltransferase
MNTTSILNLATANSIVNQQDISIQWLQKEHLPEVIAIEQLVSPSPWAKPQFIDSTESTLVLIENHKVIGFAVVKLAADQAELHNIAIHPDRQGQGMGGLFLHALIKAMPTIIQTFYLEVRVTNFRAIRLYLELGFTQIAERKDYYRSGLGREDAMIMSMSLG